MLVRPDQHEVGLVQGLQALQVKDPEFHSLGLVLGYDYPDSPVVVPDEAHSEEQPVTTFEPSADANALSAAASRLGIPLRVLDLAHLPRLRTLYEADLLLVRPDQHVAWRGAAVADPAALLRTVVGDADGPNVAAPAPTSLEEISR